MPLLKPSLLETAFLKMGIYAETGAGKTFTAVLVALGLKKLTKYSGPIAFLDSETGSDFARKQFKEADLNPDKDLIVLKSKVFSDWLEAIGEMIKAGIQIAIGDSITHPWNELVESYMKKNNITKISLRHWQPLKQTWRELTALYVNSKIHFIICGRSANIWERVEEEDGSMELTKTGTKMRTETDMGYEPSLLVEMESIQLSPSVGGKLIHRAHIKKDRWNVMNGQTFDDPTFETFLPHISLLNLGGEHRGLEQGRDSQAIFSNDNLGERRLVKRDILLEECEANIRMLFPGQSEADKQGRFNLMEQTFNSMSWKAIQQMPNEALAVGLAKIKSLRGAVPQPIATPAPAPAEQAKEQEQPKQADKPLPLEEPAKETKPEPVKTKGPVLMPQRGPIIREKGLAAFDSLAKFVGQEKFDKVLAQLEIKDINDITTDKLREVYGKMVKEFAKDKELNK